MKKMMVLVLMAALLAAPVLAQDEGEVQQKKSMEIGLRAGGTFSPDQFHFGAHTDLGKIVGPMRLVPNIEIGLGNSFTVVTFNGDFVYDIEDTDFSVGGELGIIYSKYDIDIPGVDSSSTDLGLSVLADYNLALDNGKKILFEAKLGLIDSPDFKLTVGYNFF